MHAPRNLILLSALFVFAGFMHFVIPGSYAAITPLWVPRRMEMVYLSGIAEIAGGIGVLVPRVRKAAGIGLIALLIAVFPANVGMLTTAVTSNAPDVYQTILFFRLPLQSLLIVWIYREAIRNGAGKASQ